MFIILLGFILPQCWTFCGSFRKALWKRFVICRKLNHPDVLHLSTVVFSGFSGCDQPNGAKFSKPLECLGSLNLAAFQRALDPWRRAAGAWTAESPAPGESLQPPGRARVDAEEGTWGLGHPSGAGHGCACESRRQSPASMVCGSWRERRGTENLALAFEGSRASEEVTGKRNKLPAGLGWDGAHAPDAAAHEQLQSPTSLLCFRHRGAFPGLSCPAVKAASWSPAAFSVSCLFPFSSGWWVVVSRLFSVNTHRSLKHPTLAPGCGLGESAEKSLWASEPFLGMTCTALLTQHHGARFITAENQTARNRFLL